MKSTSNYRKHTSTNPVQKYLIKRFYKAIFEIVRTLKPATILEAGCGEGFMLERLKQWGIGTTLFGVDISGDAIAIGKKLHPNLNLLRGDIYSLPFKDDSFDLVICCEVLEHLLYPIKAMDEIVRVSKKYCLLSVPQEPYFTLANFLRGKNWSHWGNDPGHINHWTADNFNLFVTSWFVNHTNRQAFPWQIVSGQIN